MDAQVARVVSVVGAPGDEGRGAAALFCSLLQNDTDLCEKFPSSSPPPLMLCSFHPLQLPSLFLFLSSAWLCPPRRSSHSCALVSPVPKLNDIVMRSALPFSWDGK